MSLLMGLGRVPSEFLLIALRRRRITRRRLTAPSAASPAIFPGSRRDRPALLGGQGVEMIAEEDVNKNNDKLLQHSHDDINGNATVDDVEIIVVQEDGEYSVCEADEEKRCRAEHTEGDTPLYLGHIAELAERNKENQHQRQESNDVEYDASFGCPCRLRGAACRTRCAAVSAHNIQDEAE